MFSGIATPKILVFFQTSIVTNKKNIKKKEILNSSNFETE